MGGTTAAGNRPSAHYAADDVGDSADPGAVQFRSAAAASRPQSIQCGLQPQPRCTPRASTGSGDTIAIVDSYGSDTIAHDLHVYDQAYRACQPMCGEEGVTCAAGHADLQPARPPGLAGDARHRRRQSNGTGLEDKAAWALEVSLDVETAHAIAPAANILLVTTPTAETLGLQGFPQMMNAEHYVVEAPPRHR